MPVLEVHGVTKEFPTRGQPLRVLDEVSLELDPGQNLAIVGPSGCGKSTLLHILGTLDHPTSGTVTLQGANPFSLSEPKLADFRNKNVGFVFQQHYLLPECSALENVLLPTIAQGNATAEQVERARELLGRVGLDQRLDHRPAELSGGEQQRTAIARALILKPTLLLADEPTGNLDQATAGGIAELLLELQRQENTILVVVTHSPELASRLDRQVHLESGKFADSSGD